MEDTPDLIDVFDDLAKYLKIFINPTGVYIAKLEHTKKKIEENDDDMAHIDPSGEEIIRCISADEDHNFMIDKVLKMNEGITPGVFSTTTQPVVKPVGEVPGENKIEGSTSMYLWVAVSRQKQFKKAQLDPTSLHRPALQACSPFPVLLLSGFHPVPPHRPLQKGHCTAPRLLLMETLRPPQGPVLQGT